MRVSFQRIPVDLVLCLLCSVILIPFALFHIEDQGRLVLGVLFMLFIPGYVLVSALFPCKRQGEGINVIERIGLSLAASIALVPLFGLALNFSPFGIRFVPLLLIMCLFIFGVGSIALYRWYVTPIEERFSRSFTVSLPVFENRFDKVITLVLAVLIITSIVLLVYVVVIPRVGEKFTEFYVLNVNGTTDQYPQNLSVGENISVILGISNHEYRTITYTIEVWLVNETTVFHASDNSTETIVNHMWFIDEMNVKLNHTLVDLGTFQEPQWEENFSFSIMKQGIFKMEFLLFTKSTEHFSINKDYKDRAEEILSSAYRELHLWIAVQ
jgi:uncharacterized membrane protein